MTTETSHKRTLSSGEEPPAAKKSNIREVLDSTPKKAVAQQQQPQPERLLHVYLVECEQDDGYGNYSSTTIEKVFESKADAENYIRQEANDTGCEWIQSKRDGCLRLESGEGIDGSVVYLVIEHTLVPAESVADTRLENVGDGKDEEGDVEDEDDYDDDDE